MKKLVLTPKKAETDSESEAHEPEDTIPEEESKSKAEICNTFAPDPIEELDELLKQGNLDEALSKAKKIVGKEPENYGALLYYSKILFLKGRFAMAWKPLDEILAKEPKHSGAISSKAILFERMGKPELAAMAYEQAISIEPDVGMLHRNMAQVLKDSGRDDESKKYLEKAQNLGVKNQVKDWYSHNQIWD